MATHIAYQIDMPDQHGALLDARLTHCAGPKRFGTDRLTVQLATVRHQSAQVGHHLFRRKGLARGGGGTRVFATTALHARIKAEQLLTAKMVDLADADATCLLDLVEAQRYQGAHGACRAAGNVKWASDDVQKSIHRNRGEKHRDQSCMEPPHHQVHRLGVAHVQSPQQSRVDQPADD